MGVIICLTSHSNSQTLDIVELLQLYAEVKIVGIGDHQVLESNTWRLFANYKINVECYE